MDKGCVPALVSQLLPHASDSTMADAQQPCELVAPVQNATAIETSSGQESVSSFIQGMDNLTLGSGVSHTPLQFRFGVETIASSLANLQITTNAEKAVDNRITSSSAMRSTSANCCNPDSSSDGGSMQEFLQNWFNQDYRHEECSECSCIVCGFLRMLQRLFVTNEAEDGLAPTFNVPEFATSSRKSFPSIPLHSGVHQCVWPSETSGLALKAFSTHSGYSWFIGEYSNELFPSQNEWDAIMQPYANNIHRNRGLRARVSSDLRGSSLARCMSRMRIAQEETMKSPLAFAGGRSRLRRFFRNSSNANCMSLWGPY
ncbi:hypothetical protein TcWFU_001983 [Taenia crassiceps]|uniref:Uncharacterized protein n=1 Tax=Taenia crassiceps TaxID=6207 RepID=A0ABR4QKA4_9CEST